MYPESSIGISVDLVKLVVDRNTMSQDSSITIQDMQALAQQYPDITFGIAGVLMLVGLVVCLAFRGIRPKSSA